MNPFGTVERHRSEYPNQPKEAVMLRETPPQENRFARLIKSFDPDVPGWLFWTIFIVMALAAMTFIR
jgi:hypothetical protein